MSSKKMNKKADVKVTTPAVPEKKEVVNYQSIPTLWSYVRYFYQQNEALWVRIAELERSNVELRRSISGVA